MRAFSKRLVARVVLIVFMVIVPALAIIVYDQFNERHRSREEAIENTSRLARLAASEQSRVLEGVQRLLSTLALFPSLRDGDAAGCRTVLPDVLRSHPSYINIFVTNSEGSMLCMAADVPAARDAGYTAKHTAWFSRAMQARGAAVGDYKISLKTGKPAVIVARPIPSPSGRVDRIIAAVVALDQLNATFDTVKLPHGATLTLTDQRGTILARTPVAPALIGTTHAQFPSGEPSGSTREHGPMIESTGSDGVRRLSMVVPLDAGLSTGLFVTLDVESAAILTPADRSLISRMWLLGLMTIGAFVVALVGGRVLVLQPVEARQREAEDRMRFALEVSKVGVWQTEVMPDGDQRVYWSETLEKMHGLKPGEFGGRIDDFLNCLHRDDRAPVTGKILQAQAERRDVEIEYRTVWPDGTERRLATTGHYTFNASGAFVRGAGVTIDVTDQRSLEEQLRQAQKMEAIGQLAGGIAHDFNNMLTAILGNAQFLADGLPPGDQRRADVDEITKAATRASTLTQQLLAFSRKQILAPKVLHLGDVVAQVTPMLRRLLGETIDLRTTMGDRNDTKADAGQLSQVVMNLAVNARDAMENGGSLLIETSDVTIDAADAKNHPGMIAGDFVLMTVTDSGHGMDTATQKRIFEPFFTTKATGKGTGLGLATVYGIIKQSGGYIYVYSEPGGGTTFKIFLPRTLDAPAFDAAEPSQSAPRGTEAILVVEDEQLVREFAAKVLTRLGYQVHTVSSPVDAITYATMARAALDLIVSDVVLPEMSGPAMAAELRRRRLNPHIIYMSGYTDDSLIREGGVAHGHPIVQKPFTSDALAYAVRRALDALDAVGASA